MKKALVAACVLLATTLIGLRLTRRPAPPAPAVSVKNTASSQPIKATPVAPPQVAGQTPSAQPPTPPKQKMNSMERFLARERELMKQHPDFKRAREESMRRGLRETYGDLEKLLHLDHASYLKLNELLMQKLESESDVFDVAAEHGIRPGSREFFELEKLSNQDVDAQINAMLSPEQQKLFAIASPVRGAEITLDLNLAETLRATGEPLTPDQRQATAVVMAQNHMMVYSKNYTGPTTGPDAFLSANEVASLTAMQKIISPTQIAQIRAWLVDRNTQQYYRQQVTKGN